MRKATWIWRGPPTNSVIWPQLCAVLAQVTPEKLVLLKAFRKSARSSKGAVRKLHSRFGAQARGDLCELLKRGFQIIRDLIGDHVG